MKITPEQLAKSGTESGHARALMCWAQQNIDKYPDLRWLTHIGHGGVKDKITAGNMKAEGLKRGIPDYLLLVRRGGYAALWIELKRPADDDKPLGRVTKYQKEWLLQAIECGHKAVICFGWKDAVSIIVAYLGIKEDNPWKAYKDKYAKMPKQWDWKWNWLK